MIARENPLLDAQQMRHADADLLSLALIDARNHSLRWLALFEEAGFPPAPATPAQFEPALWLAGHAGWAQERWVARQVQRSRGLAADAAAPPLASVEPLADTWWSDAIAAADRWQIELPGPQAVRDYLGVTLQTTLDLLAQAEPTDAGLLVFRRALWQEDQLIERFAALAQAQAIAAAEALVPPPPSRALRESLCFVGQHCMLGSAPGGFVPDAEQWAHEEAVPEFEIDAQALSWAQYAEFVEDGGYDDARCWSEAGWAWVQQQERRAPRDVEQLRHGVLLRRFGRLQRVPPTQPLLHVSWYEADAWCRWAARRLPTEVEWEIAACAGRVRGFAWGEAAEWVAGTAHAYPGGPRPAQAGRYRVQRGQPWFAPLRLRHAKARRFVAADRDEGFVGFRSCAI